MGPGTEDSHYGHWAVLEATSNPAPDGSRDPGQPLLVPSSKTLRGQGAQDCPACSSCASNSCRFTWGRSKNETEAQVEKAAPRKDPMVLLPPPRWSWPGIAAAPWASGQLQPL